jgi:hypothetical protein
MDINLIEIGPKPHQHNLNTKWENITVPELKGFIAAIIVCNN